MSANNDNSDFHLLKKIAAGSETAMHQFFKEHSSTVYSFALKRLRESADASDVLNNVMLEVWQKAHTFEGRSKVTTWVLGIANYKILDVMRLRSRNQHDELDEHIEDENSDTGLIDISVAQDVDAVKTCMDKLSSAHQQVVHLTFFEDLSYPEIAKVLECPPGTVKTRMMHAKNNLKRCLQRIMNA